MGETGDGKLGNQGTGHLLTKCQRRRVPIQPPDIGAPFSRREIRGQDSWPGGSDPCTGWYFAGPITYPTPDAFNLSLAPWRIWSTSTRLCFSITRNMTR